MTDNPYESPQCPSPLAADDLRPPQEPLKTDRSFLAVFYVAAVLGLAAFLYGAVLKLCYDSQDTWLQVLWISLCVDTLVFTIGILITAPIVLIKRVWESRRNSD